MQILYLKAQVPSTLFPYFFVLFSVNLDNFRNILAKRNWAEQRANDKFSVGGCPGEEVSGDGGGGGGVGGQGEGGGGGIKKRKQKPFDFALYNKRHVALHVAYFGWDWHGYVVQVRLIFFPG